MSASPKKTLDMPPRLSMDEYADFIAASVREHDPVHVARQKAIEERIASPFCITDDQTRGARETGSLEED